MNNHNDIRHAYFFLRALLALSLVLALEGCMTLSVDHSTSLPEAPAAQAQKPLPVPVAFIVRFSEDAQLSINPEHDFTLEAEAWRTALSRYAEPDHIYIAIAGGPPPESMRKFEEFRTTHPVVEISLAYNYSKAPFWLQFPELMSQLLILEADATSLGLLPLPLSDKMSARFSITFPGDGQGNDPQPGATGQLAIPAQDYQFTRRQWLAPLFFIPGGDEYSIYLIPPCDSCQAIELTHKELTDWRAEEKRRLLAQYLNEIRPRLAEYARRTQVHTAAAAPVP